MTKTLSVFQRLAGLAKALVVCSGGRIDAAKKEAEERGLEAKKMLEKAAIAKPERRPNGTFYLLRKLTRTIDWYGHIVAGILATPDGEFYKEIISLMHDCRMPENSKDMRPPADDAIQYVSITDKLHELVQLQKEQRDINPIVKLDELLAMMYAEAGDRCELSPCDGHQGHWYIQFDTGSFGVIDPYIRKYEKPAGALLRAVFISDDCSCAYVATAETGDFENEVEITDDLRNPNSEIRRALEKEWTRQEIMAEVGLDAAPFVTTKEMNGSLQIAVDGKVLPPPTYLDGTFRTMNNKTVYYEPPWEGVPVTRMGEDADDVV